MTSDPGLTTSSISDKSLSTQPQARWPLCCFCKMPPTLLPQALCPCCPQGLESDSSLICPSDAFSVHLSNPDQTVLSLPSCSPASSPSGSPLERELPELRACVLFAVEFLESRAVPGKIQTCKNTCEPQHQEAWEESGEGPMMGWRWRVDPTGMCAPGASTPWLRKMGVHLRGGDRGEVGKAWDR